MPLDLTGIHTLFCSDLLPDGPSMHAELNAARDAILGPADLRTKEAVAYERAPFVKEVTQDGRCYSIANTVERPRGTDAPAAALKIFEGEPTEMHRHQAKLLQVGYESCASCRLRY